MPESENELEMINITDDYSKSALLTQPTAFYCAFRCKRRRLKNSGKGSGGL
jgi:hypothetical protein